MTRRVAPPEQKVRGAAGGGAGSLVPETPVEQAKRHVASLERIIEQQEAIVRTLDALGDYPGLKIARQLLASFNHSLVLAREHVQRLTAPDVPKR